MLINWPNVVMLFQSKAFEDIVGDLLTGLIAAYFFYVLIDIIPRMRKQEQNLEVLNRLVASVVDSYAKAHFFGHTVIPPFLAFTKNRGQATMANFCLGVIPPRAIFGRS